MRVVSYEILVHASADIVYQYFTDPDALLSWMAESAESELIPGGGLRWTLANGATMRGRYVELQPPHRLVFTYGWEGDLMGVPPESTLVEIDLRTHSDGTLLSLTHRLLPDEAAEQHRYGWDHFLRRLVAALAGRADRGG
jgi:uncharacterized protein YndB with AHSA1/START domain